MEGLQTEEGANLVEYALLLAGIVLAVYLVVGLIGDRTADNVRSVIDNLPDRPGAPAVDDAQTPRLGRADEPALEIRGQLPPIRPATAPPVHPGPLDRDGRAGNGRS